MNKRFIILPVLSICLALSLLTVMPVATGSWHRVSYDWAGLVNLPLTMSQSGDVITGSWVGPDEFTITLNTLADTMTFNFRNAPPITADAVKFV